MIRATVAFAVFLACACAFSLDGIHRMKAPRKALSSGRSRFLALDAEACTLATALLRDCMQAENTETLAVWDCSPCDSYKDSFYNTCGGSMNAVVANVLWLEAVGYFGYHSIEMPITANYMIDQLSNCPGMCSCHRAAVGGQC